jgi:hypothetical protein
MAKVTQNLCGRMVKVDKPRGMVGETRGIAEMVSYSYTRPGTQKSRILTSLTQMLNLL